MLTVCVLKRQGRGTVFKFIWCLDEHVKVQVLHAISFGILLYNYTLHGCVRFHVGLCECMWVCVFF